jgi:hypothetical protein
MRSSIYVISKEEISIRFPPYLPFFIRCPYISEI